MPTPQPGILDSACKMARYIKFELESDVDPRAAFESLRELRVDAALVIGRISRSCGCTGAVVEETMVEPGGSTPLRIWLETRNRSGSIEERVVVRSNDPQTPLLELLLQATVVEETPR